MDSLPHEILSEILSRAGPLHYASRASRLFHSLCRVKQCKDIHDLREALKDNDILRIKSSDDIIYKDVMLAIQVACEERNREAALYLQDFTLEKSQHLACFDDLSLINWDEMPYIVMKYAAMYQAKEVFRIALGKQSWQEIPDLKDYVKKHFYDSGSTLVMSEVFIDDEEFFKSLYPYSSPIYVACYYNKVEWIKWYMTKRM